MAMHSTSAQRIGAIMLVVVLALLLGAIIVVRSCSSDAPAPIPVVPMTDSVVQSDTIRADSSHITLPRKKHSRRQPAKSTRKSGQLPSGSPLDHPVAR